ncbi:hypothetical protein ABRZ03_03130 [Castellaniella ginsengisoli]|uniref:Uncharacterized protein n=1 Tax=Castellaniella ginsengisoli TaxID=546114 RepID=A0AB39E3K6_9BURK
MKNQLVVSILAAAVGDALSAAFIPGGNVAGVAISKVFAKRLEAAREIFLSELATGEKNLNSAEFEESAAIVYRYLKAAQEGAARLNLRLLAAVFAGQVRERTIVADEFLYYADLLSSLRRDEIILLGTLERFAVEVRREQIGFDNTDFASRVSERARCALIPAQFQDEEHYAAVAGALLRTGLVVGLSGWNTMVFIPSKLMAELNQLVEVEGVLQRDQAMQ